MDQLDPAIVVVFGGVAAALLAATLVGLALRHRGTPSPALTNFLSRVWASWVIVLVLGAAALTGRAGTVLLFATASALALHEFVRLTEAGQSDRFAVATAFCILLPLQYVFVFLGWYGPFAVLIPVYGFLLLPTLSVLRTDTQRFMARVSELQWGLMLAVFCLSHVPALLLIDLPAPHEGRNILLVAFLIVVVQASDFFQYLWGRLLGRHKLAPAVSPSKTWEGLLLGMASGSLIGTGLWRFTPFTFLEALAVSVVLTAMGVFGGLVMSAFKRDRGVKDWGTLIPGHGGVLDRLDSVLFAAPVFFHVVRFGWAS